MSSSSLIILLGSSILNALGQLCWKYSTHGSTSKTLLMEYVTSPLFRGGLISYGISILLWLYVLKHVSVGTAYPILACSYVIVAVGGRLLFGEVRTRQKIAGLACILLGIILLALSS